jgi:anthraniloyl-CoA monooxygenase
LPTGDQVNSILSAGRADLVALARPHLADPSWTQRAAAEQSYVLPHWPNPYIVVKPRPKPVAK